MTQEVMGANSGQVAQATQLTAETIEKVLVQGNLSVLTPAERVSYYRAVCESVKLNPLTRPFDYINLNGKLVLYAKRECTDQLRFIHDVTAKILSREVIEGCYVVTSQAKMPGGREDESTGVVAIDGMKGEGRANAMMKAETKAKRRVTLSICGLSFMDETEVETVSGAARTQVNFDTGEVIEQQRQIAERKIAGMQAGQTYAEVSRVPIVEPVPRADQTPEEQAVANIKARLAQFAQMKAKIGNERYYGILGAAGYEHANEIRNLEKAREIYRQMRQVEIEMAKPPDAFDAFLENPTV